MNKFINKILSEAEDSSDDFFQSKHVEKRKREFENILNSKKNRVLNKLELGVENIKSAYNNKDWKNEREKLFLELFSKLYIDDDFYQSEDLYGYLLYDDENNSTCCFYDLKDNAFLTDYNSIWRVFEDQFNMKYDDIRWFMNKMLKEYFKFHNATVDYGAL